MPKKIYFLTAILLISVLLLVGCNQHSAKRVYIERVIDGDTVKTAAGDSIRLLGVDSPEIDWENNKDEFYAQKARTFSRENLAGKNVELKYDQEKKDSYGRRLAYIFLDGKNFNKRLLTEGYASLMIVEPNNYYEKEFKTAAAEARKFKRGVWTQVLEAEKKLPTIPYQKAAEYLKQEVVVEGKIVNTAVSDSVNYLNFSTDYQNTLTVVIFNNNLNKFDYQPAKYILNKKIKVLGKIKLYQGRLQIIVDDPYDIYFVE